uniref:Major facilitator superfamily (MFS) profile domain-containing protein n=1 Tax=Bionectria ochroleuca TaxID=29856 RepID=A0A8H7TMK6_BIOOC
MGQSDHSCQIRYPTSPLGRFTQEELDSLKAEREQVFFQSGILPVILTVALAAFLQGHVQSSINAGSLFESLLKLDAGSTQNEIGTRKKDWEIGGMNASPFLAAAIIGAPISLPTNYYIGRRGALIVSALLIIASSVSSAFCQDWIQLLGVRIIGGVGMGIKAVSAPILAAETATGYWRGSILITWQLWVACGIMIGFVANLVIAKATNVLFLKQNDIETSDSNHWLALQLILGAPLVASVALLISVYFCYESSRFYMREESPNFDPNQALKILLRIRKSKLQALRDIILIRWSEKLKRLSESNGPAGESCSPEQGLTYASQLRVVLRLSLNQYRTLFKTRRLRNAVWSTSTVALAQQLCGINVFAFYSNVVFNGTDSTIDKPMLYSFGFGAINFLFCLPAMRTIDTFGRRTWLLATLPIMGILLAGAAGAFPLDDSTVVSTRVAAGISLILIFVAVYSPGLGPIPFTLASERLVKAARIVSTI